MTEKVDLIAASAGIADSILDSNVAEVTANLDRNEQHITITFVKGNRITKLDLIPKGIRWDYNDEGRNRD